MSTRYGARRTVVGGATAVIAVAAGVLAAYLSGAPTSTWGFVIGLLGFLILGPALIARYASRGSALSPLPMVTGFFLLEFAAGAIFYRQPRQDSVLGNLTFAYTTGSLGTALLLSFAAWLLLTLGYWLARSLDSPVSLIPRPRVNDVVTGTAVVLCLVGWLARALMVRNGWYFHISDGTPVPASGLRNIVVVLSNLPMVAAGMVGARYYREAHRSRNPYWLLVAAEVLWTVPSGERSRLISLGLMLLIVRAYSSRKPFPTTAAAVLALVSILVVFPLGVAYRTNSGTATGYQSDPIGQLSAAASTTLDEYGSNPLAAVTNGVGQTFQRFAGVTSVAAIVQQGTDKYPATPGQALGLYGGALVPRALLPTKGDASTLTVDFGREYRIIAPGNNASVTMTSIGDLWGTFGLAGLAIGMLLLGGLVRGLATYFRDARDNYAIVAIYGAILGRFLLGFETSIAVGFLQTLRELVIYVVVVALVGRLVRTTASDHAPVAPAGRSVSGTVE